MAVGIVDAPVPDALVAVFGAVVDVHADVETVVGRRTDVVGPFEEEVFLAAVAQVGVVDILCGHGEAVAAVIEPFGVEVCALAEGVAHRCVDFMAVVKLVVVPLGIIVLKLTLVPRQRIGGVELQAVCGIVCVELQSVEAPVPFHHLRVPVVGGWLQSLPVGILQ